MRFLRFLMLALLALVPAFSQTLTVMVPVAVVPPGTSGVVQLMLVTPATATQPAALQFTVTGTVDTGAMTAVAGPAATAAGKQIACAILAPRSLTCMIWGLNGTLIGNGDVADVTVPIQTTATLGADPITLSNALGASVAGTAITTTVFPGSISVFNGCDLNRDGLIDINDVNVVVAQAIAGGTACTTGDLTKDVKCNVLDVWREVLAALPVSSGIAGAGVCRIGQ